MANWSVMAHKALFCMIQLGYSDIVALVINAERGELGSWPLATAEKCQDMHFCTGVMGGRTDGLTERRTDGPTFLLRCEDASKEKQN